MTIKLQLTHPDIADVAIVGKPDKEAGELPTAFVTLKSGSKITENGTCRPLNSPCLFSALIIKIFSEIIEWAETKSAHYKRLRGGVIFTDSIPKTPSGKILRRNLRAKL